MQAHLRETTRVAFEALFRPRGGAGAIIQSEFTEMTTDNTTNSAVFVDLPLAATPLNITTSADFLVISFDASGSIVADGDGQVEFQIVVDGVPIRGTGFSAPNGDLESAALTVKVPVTAGTHAVKVQWKKDFGTTIQIRPVTTIAEHASLLVEEVSA